MKHSGLLLVLFLHLSNLLFAQTIFLRAGAIRPKANITTISLDFLPKLGARFAGKTVGIVQFENIPGSEEKARLAASGIELLDYLPDNAYTVAFRGVPAANVLQQAGARAFFQLTPKQKMQAYFANDIIPAWAVKVAGTVDVWVSFYKTLDPLSVLESLKELNTDILSTDRLRYRVIALRIAANRIDEIAALPFIEFIQPAPPKDQPLNYNSRIGSRA
ncbi:MAG TPA: hypothetical protein VEX65_06580, partial [Flavisolibacter sp.]|nr:hypothetical protein [Flavisolibacter sp.]